MITYEQITALVDAEDDKLLLRIGEVLLPPTMATRGREPHAMIAAAREWIRVNLVDIRKRVCGSAYVQIYLKHEASQDRVMLVAAIADLIGSLISGIAAASVAVLLIREGLTTLCAEPLS